ncbi:hypothetical protein LTR66_017438, partial [Elasticomyces elasticus]
MVAVGPKRIATNSPARYMSKSLRRSSAKSIPAAASETRVNAECNNTQPARHRNAMVEDKPNAPQELDQETQLDRTPPLPPLPPDPSELAEGRNDTVKAQEDVQKPAPAAAGWFGWWSRPDGYGSEGEKSKSAAKASEVVMAEAQRTPLPGTPIPDAVAQNTEEADQGKDPPVSSANATGTLEDVSPKLGHLSDPNKGTSSEPVKSWFGLWSSSQNQQATELDVPPEAARESGQAIFTEPETMEETPNQDLLSQHAEGTKATSEKPVRKNSAGWAFWSKERSKNDIVTPSGTQKQIGELAVADTPSQSHPEVAQFNEQQQQQAKGDTKVKGSREEAPKGKRAPNVRAGAVAPGNTPSHSPIRKEVKVAEPATSLVKAIIAPKTPQEQRTRNNLVLPSFEDTYIVAHVPSYLERVTQYVTASLNITPPPQPQTHVSILPTPPQIKKAIAIGVHGYFPAPLIQKVLGQPTGTSIRFANFAAAAIKSWTEQHQSGVDCEIEKVALEGEGFISERVDTLWKLLLNWLSHLRSADFILVGCHSQGVPVAIMLVAKLIQLGCLAKDTRVGVCAMAGVNLGPFAEYKSRLFGGGSAAELFEFSRPDSIVSKSYTEALNVVLRHGVRVTYVGSMDDQLVSLE